MGAGILEKPFAGRQRGEHGREREMKMNLLAYPKGISAVRDGYSQKDKAGNLIWPATTKLVAIERGEMPFGVEWLEGNMPRKPICWEEWSDNAYLGAVNRSKKVDYTKIRKEREAREKAAREAELATARKEAAAEADEEVRKTKAKMAAVMEAATAKEIALKEAKKQKEIEGRQATVEKSRLQSRLAKAEEARQQIELKVETEKYRADEAAARARQVKEQLEQMGEDKLCSICLVNEKNVMFEPCRHIATCEECSQQVEKLCPLCRAVFKKRTVVFF